MRATAAIVGRGLFNLAHDARASFVGIDEHLGATQGIDVVAGRADPHRLVVVEAMTATVATGGLAENLAIDHVVAEQQHQPVQRAGEAVIVVAPAHRLRDRHRGDGFAQDLRQQRRGLRAGLDRAMDETLALAVAGAFERRPFDAGLLRETLQRPGRLAVGVRGRC
jgi:hypothetical protein